MVWVIRLTKLGLLVGGVLIVGYWVLVLLAALVLLALLLNAEDAFWNGLG